MDYEVLFDWTWEDTYNLSTGGGLMVCLLTYPSVTEKSSQAEQVVLQF
jgi:hypothetical protein